MKIHYVKEVDKLTGKITYHIFDTFEELLEYWNMFEPIGFTQQIKSVKIPLELSNSA